MTIETHVLTLVSETMQGRIRISELEVDKYGICVYTSDGRMASIPGLSIDPGQFLPSTSGAMPCTADALARITGLDSQPFIDQYRPDAVRMTISKPLRTKRSLLSPPEASGWSALHIVTYHPMIAA